jgi:Zn-dependent metalloprotease
VHINSGIPNRPFYLTATSIGGNACEIPGQVWYKTMTSSQLYLNANIPFFAKLTIRIAKGTYNGTISDTGKEA